MTDFELIRPYVDQEVPSAIERIIRNRMFPVFVHYFLNKDVGEMHRLLGSVQTVDEFQVRVMKPLLKELMQQTTTGFSASGFERLDRGKSYLYISNHRDIVLDAAWLDVAMDDVDIPLMEITFGSNLMSSQFNIDLGRLNRMFKLVRGGNPREFYKSMSDVSKYMRHVITEKGSSVWIAQRNGRTKNGDDKTEVALLKMLAMSSKDDFVRNLSQLNLCPVAVSYEYESCDFLKTAEVYISQHREYVKGKNEDMHSIRHGLLQFKGDVHFEVMNPITEVELQQCAEHGKLQQFNALARLIDLKVYEGYRLHKTNYIAYDMLYECDHFGQYYSSQDWADFESYMLRGLNELKIPNALAELRTIFLKIYALPLVNALEAGVVSCSTIGMQHVVGAR